MRGLEFVGYAENEGLCPWPPLKPFLKEGFKNPKNFQKGIDRPRELTVGSIEDPPMGPLPHWHIWGVAWLSLLPDKPKFEVFRQRLP